MKKTFLSMALAVIAMSAIAQDENLEAFRRLGVGFEVGAMGAGVQVTVPVVTNHLFLVTGFNYAKLSYLKDVKIRKTEWNRAVEKLDKNVERFNANEFCVDYFTNGEPLQTIEPLPEDIILTADATLNSSAFLVSLQYYPFKNRSWYLKAGVAFGNQNLLTLRGEADDETKKSYYDAVILNDQLMRYREEHFLLDWLIARHSVNYNGVDNLEDVMHFNIDKRTYSIRDCELDVAIRIKKVRPYVAMGWGRAIPRRRLGCQFEMGFWYHDMPTIYSPKRLDTYDASAWGIAGFEHILTKVVIYPQMTLRLTGRIL